METAGVTEELKACEDVYKRQPYGYIKDPADHNHLLIDDKVAHVVKEIFDLALKGHGVAKICRHLNKQHILRPAAYAAARGETGFERHFEGNEDKRYICLLYTSRCV